MKNIQKIGLIVLLFVLFCVGCGNNSVEMVPLEDLQENSDAFGDPIISDSGISLNEVQAGAGSGVSLSGVQDGNDNAPEYVYVFISGAVNCPGVYELLADSRLYEAVQMAGGFTADADTDYCNLAQVLTDGTQYYIPTTDEVADGGFLISQTSSGNNISSEPASSQGSYDARGRLNINRASKQELCTLPGIGETRAEAILAYREEHGDFSSIEELMNVSGIKQGTFDQLKEQITVGNE